MVDFVTSLHATFGRKLSKLRGSVEDAAFNENANGKHQKTNFEFLTQKNLKHRFFWKMDPKIQNFQNFQKTATYVIQLLVVYQCTQFQVNSSIFYSQMECFCLRNHTHIFFQMPFL